MWLSSFDNLSNDNIIGLNGGVVTLQATKFCPNHQSKMSTNICTIYSKTTEILAVIYEKQLKFQLFFFYQILHLSPRQDKQEYLCN